jgi:hypothetical protein
VAKSMPLRQRRHLSPDVKTAKTLSAEQLI